MGGLKTQTKNESNNTVCIHQENSLKTKTLIYSQMDFGAFRKYHERVVEQLHSENVTVHSKYKDQKKLLCSQHKDQKKRHKAEILSLKQKIEEYNNIILEKDNEIARKK